MAKGKKGRTRTSRTSAEISDSVARFEQKSKQRQARLTAAKAQSAPKPKPPTTNIKVVGVAGKSRRVKPGYVKVVSVEGMGGKSSVPVVAGPKTKQGNFVKALDREESVQQAAPDPQRQAMEDSLRSALKHAPTEADRMRIEGELENLRRGKLATSSVVPTPSVPPSSKASSHKPKQPKSVTDPFAGNPAVTTVGDIRAGGGSGGRQASRERAVRQAEAKPKQSSGKRQNLVMTPRQIKRRAERARKAGRG